MPSANMASCRRWSGSARKAWGPGAVEQRDIVVIPADHDVQDGFEQAALGPEGLVDQVGRDVGPTGDGRHGGRGVALLEEELLGTRDHPGARLGDLRVSERGAVGAGGLDGALLSF